MAGPAVVFYGGLLVDGVTSQWLTPGAAEAAMNDYADALDARYQQLHQTTDPTGLYGERRAHPSGNKFCVMLADPPEWPGNMGYPDPPGLLPGTGARIRWVGEDWDSPPP
jgi:hypothetical protein